MAERDGVEIRYYNIIYDLVDDVKKAMSGLLAPTLRETMLGNALILEIFNISKVGKIAGCRVTDGTVERGANVRLIRDNVVIHEGKLSQLKRFKDDAREVLAGQECGMAFENYQDMRVGDVIECYRVEIVQRSLVSGGGFLRFQPLGGRHRRRQPHFPPRRVRIPRTTGRSRNVTTGSERPARALHSVSCASANWCGMRWRRSSPAATSMIR